jgi:hypothetical protein
MGLINRTYDTDVEYDPERKKTQWQRFDHHVFHLNRKSAHHIQYKVLYLGRHGEGYHNAAESYYGTPAWDVRTPASPQVLGKLTKQSATGPKKMATAQ